tara:strand:+ start:725 stop:1330 length:606 start_codon:yes stop_codon:yes gene_type:complete
MIKKILLPLLFLFISSSVLESKNSEIIRIGDKNARIVIKVFSSLTCPHCAHFHEKVIEDLKKEYIDQNQVRFEHHSFPLDLAALNAEKILRCTNSKETSFQLLSEIYKKQNLWAVGSDINVINDSIKKIGKEFGLKESNMNKCLKDDNVQEQILNERINAQKEYKITSTPSIFINEKKYEGKHEFSEFKKVLEKVLKKSEI